MWHFVAHVSESHVQKGKSGVEITEALFVLKWGGELTHAGRKESENLGQFFRMNMFPGRNCKSEKLNQYMFCACHWLRQFNRKKGRAWVSFGYTVRINTI